MKKEDAIKKLVLDDPALFFVNDFLQDFPIAKIYLVGGAVRDAVIGRTKERMDLDFVICNVAARTIESWLNSHGSCDLVGKNFGVYKFMPKGFSKKETEFIDIALPRTETTASGSMGGYRDFDVQSNPSLAIEKDLQRRDFTMNAMAFDLRNNVLIDPFDGLLDIEQKLVRAVGNPEERFAEDLSRMLRAVRFACELAFEIETNTSNAINKHIREINVVREFDGGTEFVVPRETVGSELIKTISHNTPKAISAFTDCGIIRELFPSVQKLIENNAHYLLPLRNTKQGETILFCALLLRDLSEEKIFQALRFSGLDRLDSKTLMWLINGLRINHTQNTVIEMHASEFERCFMNNNGTMFIRCLELVGNKNAAQFARERKQKIQNLWLVDEDENIAPLLSGNDILSQGIQRGPEVRMWLDMIRDEQLEGKLLTRESALSWLKDNLH